MADAPENKILERCLTIKEAARMFGTTWRFMWNKIQDGTGPRAVKVGHIYRIEREDFRKWLNDNKV